MVLGVVDLSIGHLKHGRDVEWRRRGDGTILKRSGTVNAAGLGLDAAWRRLHDDPPLPIRTAGPPPTEGIEFPLYALPSYRLADLVTPACEQWLEREDSSSPELRAVDGGLA